MKFPSIKTIVFLIIILALLAIILFREGTAQKKEKAAAALADVSAIRAGLSAYYAERASYPKAEKLDIPGNAARTLCLARSAGEPEGFLPDGISCAGAVLYQADFAQRAAPFVYNSSGVSYQIRFILPASLGAFTSPGPYCATEKGILVGVCN